MNANKNISSYSLSVKNKLSDLGVVVEAIGTLAIKWDLPAKIVHQLNLAIEEVISNIIFYAYADDDEHEILLTFQFINNKVSINITDDGKYFNILESSSEVDINAGIEDREIGGLGIHILKQMVDHIDYKRSDNQNVLVLTKEL